MDQAQRKRIATAQGFIAALDQSGGSTPKALRLYGIDESGYASETEMFDRMHEMRTRIMTSPVFTGDRIVATILFEMTMDRQIAGKGSAEYLWEDKNIVPIVKVDKGLEEESDGVRLMKPMPQLEPLLARASRHAVFGTKMRSVILQADKSGIAALVEQQFSVAGQILDAGLVPIIEPEIDIHSPQKADAEIMLREQLESGLDALPTGRSVMLKLTPPEHDDFYADLVAHPRTLRVAALSGGYPREEATARLSRNHGMIASFSRALTEGLSVQQSDAEFDATLDASIASIYAASIT